MYPKPLNLPIFAIKIAQIVKKFANSIEKYVNSCYTVCGII